MEEQGTNDGQTKEALENLSGALDTMQHGFDEFREEVSQRFAVVGSDISSVQTGQARLEGRFDVSEKTILAAIEGLVAGNSSKPNQQQNEAKEEDSKNGSESPWPRIVFALIALLGTAFGVISILAE